MVFALQRLTPSLTDSIKEATPVEYAGWLRVLSVMKKCKEHLLKNKDPVNTVFFTNRFTPKRALRICRPTQSIFLGLPTSVWLESQTKTDI